MNHHWMCWEGQVITSVGDHLTENKVLDRFLALQMIPLTKRFPPRPKNALAATKHQVGPNVQA